MIIRIRCKATLSIIYKNLPVPVPLELQRAPPAFDGMVIIAGKPEETGLGGEDSGAVRVQFRHLQGLVQKGLPESEAVDLGEPFGDDAEALADEVLVFGGEA